MHIYWQGWWSVGLNIIIFCPMQIFKCFGFIRPSTVRVSKGTKIRNRYNQVPYLN